MPLFTFKEWDELNRPRILYKVGKTSWCLWQMKTTTYFSRRHLGEKMQTWINEEALTEATKEGLFAPKPLKVAQQYKKLVIKKRQDPYHYESGHQWQPYAK